MLVVWVDRVVVVVGRVVVGWAGAGCDCGTGAGFDGVMGGGWGRGIGAACD
ncbi:MAG: hypothetical protein ACR2IP_07005 [Solirubrobacteraceae bacterium]